MNLPYIDNHLQAFITAETSVAAALTAIVWHRPIRPMVATVFLIAALWIAALIPIAPNVVSTVGVTITAAGAQKLLWVSEGFFLLGAFGSNSITLKIWAPPIAACLFGATRFFVDSDMEVCALHVIGIGLLLGVHEWTHARAASAERNHAAEFRFGIHDFVLFCCALALSCIVSTFVLGHFTNSGDEWANIYQADLFAHGKAYGSVPACEGAFKNYWVFFYKGKAFAQYPPGWPAVMALFFALRIWWLATPFVFALGAVGIARLGRRLVLGLRSIGEDRSAVASAGIFAAATYALGASALLNGASLFPHTLVCCAWAWGVESAAHLAGPERGRGCAMWGAIFGLSVALLFATRPGDGATLGGTLGVYTLYATIRRRLSWRAFVAGIIAFAMIAVPTILILHAQLGTWFKTGYSIAGEYFAWAKPQFNLPARNEFRFGVPLYTGAYSWWPAAPSIGILGLVLALRGRERRVALILGLGTTLLLALISALKFGRYFDSGYGPRFVLPTTVAMSAGTGVIVAHLWRTAKTRWSSRAALTLGGPAVLAIAAFTVGLLRIVPAYCNVAHHEVMQRNAPFIAINKAQLRNAVVTIRGGEIAWDPMDLTQNLPTRQNPNVIIAQDAWNTACLHREYPNRTFYRAVGKDTVELIPQ